MRWFKRSDWLPLSNAKAQVEFWEKDLVLAEEYLTYVKTFEGKGLSRYETILKIALRDIETSKKELMKAKEKLQETIDRDGIDG
jgi:hypothetical protein